jgi:stage III sporulation protein SpoIIIAA
MTNAPFPRNIEEAHAEVERELHVRQRCFPRWVEEGRVSKMDAKDRLERLSVAEFILKNLLDRDTSDVPA